MALKGIKLNLAYFLLHILGKLSSANQNTIVVHDQFLFRHGLIKILVQHQLSLTVQTWDQFLTKNNLEKDEFWMPVRPKTQVKRKKSSLSES